MNIKTVLNLNFKHSKKLFDYNLRQFRFKDNGCGTLSSFAKKLNKMEIIISINMAFQYTL